MKAICRTLESEIATPWVPPVGSDLLPLTRYDGTPPTRETTISIWRTKSHFNVLFDMEDEREIQAPLMEHDSPLWKHDVVEVFLAPETPHRYFELELSPLATRFSASVESPDLHRETMKTDLDWSPGEFFGFVRRDGTSGMWRTRSLITISLDSLGPIPSPGETWLANFYRIDRSPEGDEFSAWSPTSEGVPDFHRPERFGKIEFA